jgi:linoleate 10R-lipoxygenase
MLMLLDSLVRGSDGRFADADLAKILQDATESPASAFKARGTPAYMRVVEMMGIEASRAWGTCSVSQLNYLAMKNYFLTRSNMKINEFRKFMGLKPYSSFLEWNPNKDVAATAEKLYGEIDVRSVSYAFITFTDLFHTTSESRVLCELR